MKALILPSVIVRNAPKTRNSVGEWAFTGKEILSGDQQTCYWNSYPRCFMSTSIAVFGCINDISIDFLLCQLPLEGAIIKFI